ncbi:ChaN family lipoprotein [Geomesophilobacter sediminis]|uniref:ChaN family lipoprotein n=1 Tax=Geomesophilobacter sediminis TaxID=2798584 RepID=A0A8J7LUQ9_9BACT|nr:ChaN family lipoprotein [Geomesophilobacter sediminis]MBJ6724000.1 ChaN family lipoprotein [Geomesophilobacter sediminis]
MPKSPLFLLLFLLCFLPGCSVTHALRVQDRQRIDVETMLHEVVSSRIILVGERHDDPAHHQLQLEVVKAARNAGKPVAIGMEMFEGVSQNALDAWSAGKVSEATFVGTYLWNWRNLPWGLYRDILIYARDQHIPVIALNAPRDLVLKVSQQGFASLTDVDLRRLPEGAAEPLPEEYLAELKAAYPVHGGNFVYISEAQMLRNRVMARKIEEYLGAHPERVMVVIAGGGHVREKAGVPEELKIKDYRIIIPTVPGLNRRTVTPQDGHYLIEDPFFDMF